MASKEYESYDLPAVGEVRARSGTSTAELAGAVKVWYDRYQTARKDGFIAGVSLLAMAELLAFCGFKLYRFLHG